jgi:hypothetical protein
MISGIGVASFILAKLLHRILPTFKRKRLSNSSAFDLLENVQTKHVGCVNLTKGLFSVASDVFRLVFFKQIKG